MAITLEYMMQPAKRWTFEQPKLKKWVESYCRGTVLNLFAGKVYLDVSEFRVDISDEFDPDAVMDAFDYVSKTSMKYDTIILDPPYNIRKAREKYNGRWIGSFTKIKNALVNIIKDKGIVITLGYKSTCMGKGRGFKKIAICLVCHSGDHNDTICLVEQENSKEVIQSVVDKYMF